jgi:hypothetical protein
MRWLRVANLYRMILRHQLYFIHNLHGDVITDGNSIDETQLIKIHRRHLDFVDSSIPRNTMSEELFVLLRKRSYRDTTLDCYVYSEEFIDNLLRKELIRSKIEFLRTSLLSNSTLTVRFKCRYYSYSECFLNMYENHPVKYKQQFIKYCYPNLKNKTFFWNGSIIPDYILSEKYSDINWSELSCNTHIPEDFFALHINKISWHNVCFHNNISEQFYKNYIDHVDWYSILRSKHVRKAFIDRYIPSDLGFKYLNPLTYEQAHKPNLEWIARLFVRYMKFI